MVSKVSKRPLAVVILSGGLDSTALTYSLRNACDLHLISFDYGQRHRKELDYAAITADKLGARHSIVDLSSITQLISGSALTSSEIEVPSGHYAEETMKLTVVPNRNAIMLSIAYGAAVNDGAEFLFTAVHAGDHAVYADCRPEFIDQLKRALRTGNEGFGNPSLTLLAPFVNISKAEIARIGKQFGMPFEDTWSCYVGGAIHCGHCSTCIERLEAIDEADVYDPSEYEDREYWKTVIKEYQLSQVRN